MPKNELQILNQINSMEEYAEKIKIIATRLRKKLGQVSAPAPSGDTKLSRQEIMHVLNRRKKNRPQKIA